MRKGLRYFLYVGLALLLGVVLNRGSGTRVSYAAPSAQTVANVAQGKPASQSSTYTADYPASRAVDGNTDGNYLSKSINHTNSEVNPWWQVDLGSATTINTITLWNRTDCCSDRLTNFFVFVANYDMTGKGFGDLVVDNTVWRYSLGTTAPTTLNIPVNTTGRYVRVQLAGANALHLAEVQVFGAATSGTGATVADGVYLVKAVHSGKCMEVAGAGAVNGSNVQQWSCNPTAGHHQWQFTAVGNGYYKITNVNSGKVLDVAGISTADGANLDQWDNLDGSNQKWKPVAQSDGSYQLVALHSNKCADVSGAATADGANLAQYGCHTGTNQRFTLTPVTAAPPATTNLPEGAYTLKAVHSGKCLQVNGASKTDAAFVLQWGCNATTANQQWRFVAVGNNYYKIINANSGKVLDVSSSSTFNWAIIWQWSDLNRNNQQWKPVRQSDGSYQLVAAHSNKCADVAGSATATYDGAFLYQYDCNTGANQRFTLTPISADPPATTNLPEGIYLVKAVHSGKCMQVIGARLLIGVNTEQWICDVAAKHQQWRFVAVGNGYYKIININSGKVLDVWGVSVADTMPLWQMDDLNRDNQKWKPVLQSDGSYQLVALHSNKCGTVTNAATADGAGIAQYPCGTGANQRFKLELLAETIVTNFEDNSLGMFTTGNGSSLTNDAESGQKAAIAPATGNTVSTRNAISPQTPITVIAWVKGVGTAYVSFARSNFTEISNTYRAVNSPTWQQITFAATAPIGTAAYDLVFRADNGAFLVDNIVVILNERDTDNDSLSDRVESCSNLGSLNYEFYDISVAGYNLNNLPTTGALAKGVTTDFDVQRLQNQFTPTDPHHYGLRYSGYLWITEAGQYTFFTNSDDGSLLSLDYRLVVNNDGSHPLTERSGTVYLYAGLHRFQLLYSAYTTPNSLAAQWSGPSFSKTALPFNRLLSCDPNTDTDQDGIPNVRDLDSDDDSIPDAVENGG